MGATVSASGTCRPGDSLLGLLPPDQVSKRVSRCHQFALESSAAQFEDRIGRQNDVRPDSRGAEVRMIELTNSTTKLLSGAVVSSGAGVAFRRWPSSSDLAAV